MAALPTKPLELSSHSRSEGDADKRSEPEGGAREVGKKPAKQPNLPLSANRPSATSLPQSPSPLDLRNIRANIGTVNNNHRRADGCGQNQKQTRPLKEKAKQTTSRDR